MLTLFYIKEPRAAQVEESLHTEVVGSIPGLCTLHLSKGCASPHTAKGPAKLRPLCRNDSNSKLAICIV